MDLHSFQMVGFATILFMRPITRHGSSHIHSQPSKMGTNPNNFPLIKGGISMTWKAFRLVQKLLRLVRNGKFSSFLAFKYVCLVLKGLNEPYTHLHGKSLKIITALGMSSFIYYVFRKCPTYPLITSEQPYLLSGPNTLQ